ncbi:hypothetical protein EC991_007369 [Linnemannia zychae]|nr:hypothetical protein EC991_007369 [Linnemannia zychae]
MSMATTIERLQEPAAEHTLSEATTPSKGKAVSSANTETPLSALQDDSPRTAEGAATTAAASASMPNSTNDDDEGSIEFVTAEPDTTASSAETTTDAPLVPFEGDGADPALPVPPRSTLDWLAYTVSLNYNRLATSVFSPITRWHWFDPIPNTRIILGAVPSQHLLIQLQREYAVQDIVNMCAEFKGHLQTMKELGLVQCWLPTRDFSTPSLENIWAGVRFIEKCERGWREEAPEHGQAGAVYVHCKAGRGRSATVVLCWLVYFYKLTVLEAQVILLKARGQVDKNVYLHPEVISFYKQVQDQEKDGTLVRKVWPSPTDHVNSSSTGQGEGQGGTEETDGGTGGGV